MWTIAVGFLTSLAAVPVLATSFRTRLLMNFAPLRRANLYELGLIPGDRCYTIKSLTRYKGGEVHLKSSDSTKYSLGV